MKLEKTQKLLDIMEQLRDPKKGCAWDLKQDFYSLIPYTLEEAYEVVDAIEREDMDDLETELGDLLLQVIFYTRIAEEQGLFNFERIAGVIGEKLVRRHPHVFAGKKYASDAERKQAWEAAKFAERQAKEEAKPNSVLADIPRNMPALMYCEKILDRAANHGFDWPDIAPVFNKIKEELGEIEEAWQAGDQAHIQEEVGDLLLVVVNLSRHLQVNPELALKEGNRKFYKRFNFIEQQVALSGRELDDCKLAELDNYWQLAKVTLKNTNQIKGQ